MGSCNHPPPDRRHNTEDLLFALAVFTAAFALALVFTLGG